MPTVFISYSHKDAAWKERLVTQLSVLEHVGLPEVWDDRRIEVGQEWEREIEAAMSAALPSDEFNSTSAMHWRTCTTPPVVPSGSP